jgi:hypothetical protein
VVAVVAVVAVGWLWLQRHLGQGQEAGPGSWASGQTKKPNWFFLLSRSPCAVFCEQTVAWAQNLARDGTCPASVLPLLPCTVFHTKAKIKDLTANTVFLKTTNTSKFATVNFSTL